ncbi:hypothetical protein B0T26DRAFT_332165 [Lasiosphaeria miniovina]|uniref:Uncharacterized protein n=1 Tax=Lasiosphaeria miniovina TaxID=1954250 RepID=A0AA40DWT1_9PEZI|nr:uncharacterized protein B0T26DRAFT_332165 [Lasiosphaeria miniovina]KAK0718490.1 hypothetical protein B0T26DRAFT_332165 [Lasiosphaeria miniovina]
MASELATMELVRQHTSIPIPQVYGFELGLGPENPVGCPFFLLGYIHGSTAEHVSRAHVDVAGIFDQTYYLLRLPSLGHRRVGAQTQRLLGRKPPARDRPLFDQVADVLDKGHGCRGCTGHGPCREPRLVQIAADVESYCVLVAAQLLRVVHDIRP